MTPCVRMRAVTCDPRPCAGPLHQVVGVSASVAEYRISRSALAMLGPECKFAGEFF
jgi:hypothetical protein